jgi:hypothetical protein
MSDLTKALQGLASTDFSMPTGLGAGINNAYKSVVPTDVRNFIWDPQRDSPIGNLNYTMGLSSKLFSGQDPFSGAGDTQYNQDVAKRAALVGAIFGGAALAGGGSAAEGVGGMGTAAGGTAGGFSAPAAAATPGTMAGIGAEMAAPAAASAAPAWMPAAAGGPVAASAPAMAATPGTTAAMYETLGATAPAAPATPGTMAAIGAGAAVPGGPIASTAGAAAAAPVAAKAASSWLPYAQAGGSILSTLFSGLLQMEKDKEANIQKLQMAQAESKTKRAQELNQGLDRLMQVWGRR